MLTDVLAVVALVTHVVALVALVATSQGKSSTGLGRGHDYKTLVLAVASTL